MLFLLTIKVIIKQRFPRVNPWKKIIENLMENIEVLDCGSSFLRFGAPGIEVPQTVQCLSGINFSGNWYAP